MWNPIGGYGFIERAGTGREVVCPRDAVEGKHDLPVGASVSFDLVMSERGQNLAKDVRLVKKI